MKEDNKNKTNNIILKICVGLIVVPVALGSVMTLYAPFDKKTESKKENRVLSKMPAISAKKIMNGEFVGQFEQFLNDHILMRSQIIDAAAEFEILMKKDLEVKLTKGSGKRKDIGSDALILDDRILALYIGNNEYTESLIKNSKDIFETIPKGIDKYMAMSPSRVDFETEYCKQFTDSQKDEIEEVYSNIPKDVKCIDCYKYMEYAVQNNPLDEIYFRTDHHWTPLGAAYAANAILEAMGKQVVYPSNYEVIDMGDFAGYLVAMHEDSVNENMTYDKLKYYSVSKNIIQKAYGVEGADINECVEGLLVDPERAGYYTFVERSYQYVVINGGQQGGGSLMMINDSYGNALVPWLAEQYETIIMIDPRTYKGGKEKFLSLIDEYEVDSFMINLTGLVTGTSFGNNMADVIK